MPHWNNFRQCPSWHGISYLWIIILNYLLLVSDGPFSLNINLQLNFAVTGMIDAYGPNNSGKKVRDSFTTINIGMKYNPGT